MQNWRANTERNKQAALTLVVGAEASVAVVAVGHKMEAEPVFVADHRRWDIAARQPERERQTDRRGQ